MTQKTRKKKQPTTLKEVLKTKLTKKQLEILPRAFDIVGSIAIFIDFPKELEKKEKMIGEALLGLHKHIETVAKKTGQHSGKYRTPKLRIIAGKRTKETTHKENAVQLKLHVEKVYFSTRSATERKRIAEQVKPGEDVLVMFSGCGPFVFVIAKNTKAKSVYGVEINPTAHKYAEENMKLNKAKNAILINGDVKKIIPNLNKKVDRILMPLPRGGEAFLDVALAAAKKNTTIHFYDFLKTEDIPTVAVKKIDSACKKAKKKCKILGHVKCGQFSPSTYRVCVDFNVLN